MSKSNIKTKKNAQAYFKISPKDIKGVFPVKVDVGLSVPYQEQWVEYNGQKYWCRKIGNEDWTVTKIKEFPFYKLPKDFDKLTKI